MSKVTFIYPVHNRLEYNQITLPLILEEVRTSESVSSLVIFDDMSEDGTSEWIQSLPIADFIDKPYIYQRKKIGNSTQQWNMARDLFEADYYANFCNDNLIPLGVCDLFASILDRNGDAFGVGGRFQSEGDTINGFSTVFPFIKESATVAAVNHLGCGMFRGDTFAKLGDVGQSVIPGEERYFGFTAYQNKARENYWRILLHHGVTVHKLSKSFYSRLRSFHDKGYTRKVYDYPESVFNFK